MPVLLDTHILIWLIAGEFDRFTESQFGVLDPTNSSVFVSVVSMWEIKLKHGLGRLDLGLLPQDVPRYCREARMSVLSVTVDHVLADLDPWPPTRDPFDRLLLAQAQVEGLRFMTMDRALAGHPLAWRDGA